MSTPPKIGITCAIMHQDHTRALYNGRALFYVEASLVDYVARAGALPYLLPPMPADGPLATQHLAQLDGLILQGGADVAPETYGEVALRPEWAGDAARDTFELDLIEAALALDLPILGICRGAQLLNVAFGGTLYQDLQTQCPEALEHRNAELYASNHHAVSLVSDSSLAHLYGVRSWHVNSVHHQGVKDMASSFVLEAFCPDDGVVEAFRLPMQTPQDPYVRGVQWHPEFQTARERDLLPAHPLMDDFLAHLRHRDH